MKPSFKENNMRKHYWTCSRFADYIRGTKQPKYGTGSRGRRADAGWSRAHALGGRPRSRAAAADRHGQDDGRGSRPGGREAAEGI